MRHRLDVGGADQGDSHQARELGLGQTVAPDGCHSEIAENLDGIELGIERKEIVA